jgi:hypothetical protein
MPIGGGIRFADLINSPASHPHTAFWIIVGLIIAVILFLILFIVFKWYRFSKSNAVDGPVTQDDVKKAQLILRAYYDVNGATTEQATQHAGLGSADACATTWTGWSPEAIDEARALGQLGVLTQEAPGASALLSDATGSLEQTYPRRLDISPAVANILATDDEVAAAPSLGTVAFQG